MTIYYSHHSLLPSPKEHNVGGILPLLKKRFQTCKMSLHRFVVSLLGVLLLGECIHASNVPCYTYEEVELQRGVSIYYELSTLWLRKTDEVEMQGLTPFMRTFEILNNQVQFQRGINKKARESLLNDIEQMTPSVTLQKQAVFNRVHHQRSSIFCMLNVLENDVFFKALGFKYNNGEDFIITLLRSPLFGLEYCKDSVYGFYKDHHPSFYNILHKVVFMKPKNEEEKSFQRTVVQLLWEEPCQSLALALNTALEVELAQLRHTGH